MVKSQDLFKAKVSSFQGGLVAEDHWISADDLVRGIPKKETKMKNTLWTIVIIFFSFFMWWNYINQIWAVHKFYAFGVTLGTLSIYIGILMTDVADTKVGWEKNMSLWLHFSLWVIALLVTDLIFEIYIFSTVFSTIFGLESVDILNAITIKANIIAIIINSTEEKRKHVLYATRIVTPVFVLVGAIGSLIFMILSRLMLAVELAEINFYDIFPTLGTGDIFIYTGVMGQYGSGADMFTAVFNVLFYSPTSAFVLAVMIVGNFTNIFFINRTRVQGIQSITTAVVIGLPMIVIALIFVGQIPPPSSFVALLGGSEVMASFIYTFAMVSVFAIFLGIMTAFSEMAEMFQPSDD